MRFPPLLYILGWLMMGFGAVMTVPTFVAWGYHDVEVQAFFQTSVLVMFVGVLLILMNRDSNLTLTHKEGFFLTVLSWTLLSVIGALPFYLSGVTTSFVNALFEATSGLTTTGATVFKGLEHMGHGVLLWRAMLQWLGGMGILVFAVAILPFMGVGGMQLYRSEMPGVTKDKLQPRLKETAQVLWVVYTLFTGLCALAYWLAGMPMFEAVCHSMATLSTGGFGTYDESFLAYNSPLIESVAMFFMLAGGINFALHYKVLISGRIGFLRSNEELRWFGGMFLVAVGLIFLSLVMHDYPAMEAVRVGLFQVVSLMTTTGYTTTDYTLWPVMTMFILMSIMFIGACSGSTTGGMKVMRALVVIKHSFLELRRLVHPHGVVHLKIGQQTITPQVIQSVWAFVGLYVFTIMSVAMVLSAFDLDFETAFGAALATTTNVGPGFGDVGPASTFVGLPAGAKLTLCVAMLLGRLELFTVLVLFTPGFWRR